MTQPAKSQEPAMEEVLVSVRRIIADDDGSKTSQRAAEPPKSEVQSVAPPRAPSGLPVNGQSEPSAPEVHAKAPVDSAAMGGGNSEDHAVDIPALTESLVAPAFGQLASASNPTPTPQFRKIEAYSDVSLDEAEQKPAMQKSMEGSALFARGDGGHGLLSSATSSAVDSAFNMLAQTLLVQDARTLEDLVRETLRPTLKSWLDDNLPGVVERLVRVEIERAARGH